MKNCTSPADKSCLKEWYNVGKISDIFYKLGCSEMAVAAGKETAMGTGERTVFTCNTNYCNTSAVMHPAMWLLGLANIFLYKKPVFNISVLCFMYKPMFLCFLNKMCFFALPPQKKKKKKKKKS